MLILCLLRVHQEKIEFTLPDVVPLKVYDTGAQFALPPDGYGGSSTTCPNGCSLTLCNNGLKYIMNQGVFMPQNTGFWTTPAIMKSTNQIWENYGRSATKDSADPFAGQYSAKIDNVAAYGTIVNIGCNIASPISQVGFAFCLCNVSFRLTCLRNATFTFSFRLRRLNSKQRRA